MDMVDMVFACAVDCFILFVEHIFTEICRVFFLSLLTLCPLLYT